ncbi:MAG: hypothetical protein KAI66_16700 [Lentisphaeria bacterium]|nr:hypothetical protein [Lentisphaeria bacterium]
MAEFNPNRLADFLPFQDFEECERVRGISRADVVKSPRDNLKIRVIEDDGAFNFGFILDIVSGIKRALDEGRQYVVILPAPNPLYALAAAMINELNIPCHHVHTFNMDDYCDQDGITAPRDWRGGFQYWMWRDFFNRIRPELRMPEKQIHFPTHETYQDYSAMLEDLGGADMCYGGIGWSGHIAFVEPNVGQQVDNDLDAFLNMGTMHVKLTPITVCQNCLYADAGGAGDWARLPWNAYTIGPKDVAAAKKRASWNGFGCGDSMWQRFIIRLALHGPVTPEIPASILQLFDTDVVLSGSVAADCSLDSCERRVPITF